MRLLSHVDRITAQGRMGYREIGRGGARCCLKGLTWSLGLDDNLKRATYRPGGADDFTVCTPVALNRLNEGDDIADYG